MRMIRKVGRWWRRSWGHKYINGGRGVISIFLACLMLPFLSLADYMVETARYHGAVQILNDAIDSGNLSVLADYDQYLFDRFGILSVSQSQSRKKYDYYIKSNLDGTGAWTGVRASEELQNPLSDADILKRQVLEASKFASPVALANDMALSQLISKLEGINESLSKMTGMLDSYAKYTDSAISTQKGADKLNECAKKLPDLEKAYHEKYSTFEEAAQALIDYEPLTEEDEEAEETEETEDSEVSLQQLEEDYITAKKEYLSAINDLKDCLEEYQQDAADLIDNTNTLVKNAQGVYESHEIFSDIISDSANNLKKESEELGRKIAEAPDDQKEELRKQQEELMKQSESLNANNKTIVSTTQAAANSYQKSTSENLKSYDKEACDDIVNNLDTCITNVGNLSTSILESNYDYKVNEFYISGKNLCVSAGISVVKKMVESQLTEMLSMAKAASAAIKNLFTTNIMYDSSLDAIVSADMLELDSESGWVDVMSAFQKLAGDLSSLEGNAGGILNILINIKNMILDALDLINGILKVVAGIVVRAIESVKEIVQGEAGEKILIAEYLTKSLANRTNKLTGSDLYTGYKFANVQFAKTKELDGYAVVGGLSALINTLKGMARGGEDKIFCGAELEYILTGSSMEIANQAAVFLQIYLVRLIFDIVPVVIDDEVKLMAKALGAASFGIGTVVVYIVELFVQPLIETITIVNGGNINLWNSVIYLTPSGVVCALGHLTSFKLTEEQSKELKMGFSEISKIQDSIDIKSVLKSNLKDNDGYTWDYDNYCFVLLMLTGETDSVMHRLANVMYMEANAYYGEGNFDIEKTYTSVTGTVSGQYQVLLPFDHLSDTGFGKVEKSSARSY